MSSARPPTDRRQRRLAQSRIDRARRQQSGSRSRWNRKRKRTRRGPALVAVAAGGAALVALVGVFAFTRQSGPPRPMHLNVHTLLRVAAASSVVKGDGAAWETDDLRDLLVRFDPSDGRTRGSVILPGRPVAIILDAGGIWVASMVSNTVEEISPRSMRVVRKVKVPQGPSDLAALDGRIWVSSVVGNEVTPLDPTDGVLGRGVQVSGGAVRLAAGFGALW